MSDELRFTETNSADDSQGRTWGLEGDLFWFVAGGAFAFIVILLVCFSVWQWKLSISLLTAAVPLAVCLTYIFIFRQGKPVGYDVDCMDYWINGSGFGPDFQKQIPHPLFTKDV